MTVGEHVLEFAYDASGTPMTVTLDGVTYYYLTNIQGDVVSIIDGNGALVAHYTYDAWGNPNAGSSHSAIIGYLNPLRYRGYVYDQEIGLYYLQSRYYSPKTGRFINADGFVSTGQGLIGSNMFAYCANNPINHYDPSGFLFLDAAIELLKQWLFGEGNAQLYGAGSSIVKALEKSSKVRKYAEDAINLYKSTGRIWSDVLTGEFTPAEDGLDLYLSTQHFSYQTVISHVETKTISFLWWKWELERYHVAVMIYDEYDFDPKAWDGVGNALNNIAALLHTNMGVGNDYTWTAVYSYTSQWKKVN